MSIKYCCRFTAFFAFAMLLSGNIYAWGNSAPDTAKTPDQQKIDSINETALNMYLTNPAQARKLAQGALILSRRINYTLGIGNSFLYIGKTYWAQSYYPIGLFYDKTALPYLIKTNVAAQISDCYRCIGRNYLDLGKHKEGFFNVQKAIKLAGNDKLQLELAITERAYAYRLFKQYDRSVKDVYTAIKLSRQIGQEGSIAILYSRLYNVYLETGDLKKAKAYMDTTYSMALALKNNRLLSSASIGMANIAFMQKRYPEALQYAQRASTLADSLGLMEFYAKAARLQYRVHNKTGDKDKAMLYQQKYIALQDSLNTADRENSVQLIQDYFGLTNKLHDIEQIEHKNEVSRVLIQSQWLTILTLGTTIIALLIAVYILYMYSKQKNELSKQLSLKHQEALQQNKLIETQSDNLNDLNQMKDRLLAIIGHDLKGPLANVRGIVDLFDQGFLSEEEVRKLMKEMDPAIKGAELTLSNLIEWAGSRVKGERINITTVDLLGIAEEMRQVNKHPLMQKNITVHIDIPSGEIVLADAHHVKMILRNLISNAIKFSPQDGSISIWAKQQAAGEILITVKDTGKGMTADEVGSLFSANTHFSTSGTKGEKGTGIGLLLCRQLVELNGGTIGAASIPGKGSDFYFVLLAA